MADENNSDAASVQSERVVIGISFGNSNSSIACTVDDKAEVIANEDGDRQIPTFISYVEGDEYYGQQAKQFIVRNPKNTVAFFRDFLGQDFKSIDPTHSHASAHPEDVEGAVSFTVVDKAEEDAQPSKLSVSEITTRYIRRLVNSASEYLGKKVTSAVLTIPTNFTDKQKAALKAACQAAGLEVLQLISEPASALLAYDMRPEALQQRESKVKDKFVVVADLGGTRSDVAVIANRGGMYTTLATAHDYEFAGFALDKILMDHFAKEFLKRHAGVDPRENARSLAKLRLEAESTKKALSRSANATFSVESLAEGFDFSSTLNRLRYETLARPVFEGISRLIESAVKKAELDVLEIDEVILSGGTANTPRIASNLAGGVFPESTSVLGPSTSPSAVNPSELQARGAALQASLIQDYELDDIEQSTHAAVTTVPHLRYAIGINLTPNAGESGDGFVPIIEPQTPVPVRRTVTLQAAKAGGDVLLQIVEASREIRVTKPQPKPAKPTKPAKTDGESKSKAAMVEDAPEDGDDEGADEDDDSDSDEEEEEAETRKKAWKVGAVLAEAALRGVAKSGKVEVTVQVGLDLGAVITAREVGAKAGAGVRVVVPGK